MKYFLDFDRTLFDTDAFVVQAHDDNKTESLSTPEIWHDYRAEPFLYHDAIHFLRDKRPGDVTIVTAVTEIAGKDAHSFQKAKVEQTPVTDHVGAFVYVVGEKGEMMKELTKDFNADETIIFIDDKIEQCLSVKQLVPHCHCFLLVRNPADSGAVQSVTGVTIVHTLQDAEAAINLL
jgi:hypothetical protein